MAWNNMAIDALDALLIELMRSEPRISVLEAARRLGFARGTIQAHIDKLLRSGVVKDFGPTIDPGALGYGVTAFVTAQIAQGERDGDGETIEHLSAIPEVIEAHTITGDGDLLIRVVAQSNSDLQRVIDRVVSSKSIVRTATVIVLASPILERTLPLVRSAGAGHANTSNPG